MRERKSGSKRPKAFVGMSGGVDSAVSAGVLKRLGYDVTGVFIKVWQPDWIQCDWREERLDAMRAAAHLDIPFVTLDLEKEYKQGVIDYMISEYKAGRTPNPDVMCNREVKFGAFRKWALEGGADFVATGHYARLSEKAGAFRLLAGKDKEKDQSYFLWTLTQKELRGALFPVGGMKKAQVRSLARSFGLPNSEKKDSQGLCFIGKVDLKDFLRHFIDPKSGDVLNEAGEKIGSHPGSLLFTIGERHGFTIDKKTPKDAPYYIIGKDATKNTLTVSNRKVAAGRPGSAHAGLRDCNWIAGRLEPGSIYQARPRYRADLADVKIETVGADEARVSFARQQAALAPGQSLVVYKGEECLGGGIIV